MRSNVYNILLHLSVIITQALCEDCPPLRSPNVDKSCEYPGKGIASCDKHSMPPGTRANITCKQFFEYTFASPVPPHREITCLANGAWDPPPFDCVPECGKATPSRNKQIVNGWDAELGTFPWHVGVYYLNWTSGELDHICGGSLISTELVVSAAHCFYNEPEGRVQDAFHYLVAAGRLHRSYYEMEDTEQKSPLQSIHVPFGYRGDRKQQVNDIAILRLRERFSITNFVRPVCLDSCNTAQFLGGQIGKVMGWGADVEGYPNEELQEINLPYIDRNFCKEDASTEFGSLVTSDKICAGYRNGSSTCHGDSGGGLCFRSHGRWYLRGIVSSGDVIKEGIDDFRCNHHYYTAFTNVANYTSWIKSVTTDAGISEACHICPCNGNERKCEFDRSGAVKCHCLAGYTGNDCSDNEIGGNKDAPAVETKLVPYGSDFEMYCRPQMTPPIRFQWHKLGGSLPENSRIDDNRLVLQAVKAADAGNYICRASNGREIVEQHLQVLVVTGVSLNINQAPQSSISSPALPAGSLLLNMEVSFKLENPDGIIPYKTPIQLQRLILSLTQIKLS